MVTARMRSAEGSLGTYVFPDSWLTQSTDADAYVSLSGSALKWDVNLSDRLHSFTQPFRRLSRYMGHILTRSNTSPVDTSGLSFRDAALVAGFATAPLRQRTDLTTTIVEPSGITTPVHREHHALRRIQAVARHIHFMATAEGEEGLAYYNSHRWLGGELSETRSARRDQERDEWYRYTLTKDIPDFGLWKPKPVPNEYALLLAYREPVTFHNPTTAHPILPPRFHPPAIAYHAHQSAAPIEAVPANIHGALDGMNKPIIKFAYDDYAASPNSTLPASPAPIEMPDWVAPVVHIYGGHCTKEKPTLDLKDYEGLRMHTLAGYTDTFVIAKDQAYRNPNDPREAYTTQVQLLADDTVRISLCDPHRSGSQQLSYVIWRLGEAPKEYGDGSSHPLSIEHIIAIHKGLSAVFGQFIDEPLDLDAHSTGREETVKRQTQTIYRISQILGITPASKYTYPSLAA